MAEKEKNLSRRQFMKTAGIAGVGAAFMGSKKTEAAEKKAATAKDMPLRAFGKTGEKVSILAFGGILDTRQNQLLLRQAIQMGVTYWDTSEGYFNGASEEGMGQYLEKYPDDRKKIFLVSKARSRDPEGLTKALTGSLERLKTSYVDLYFLHGSTDAKKDLTPEVKQWVEKAKSEGKIKYFGFSTHMNVEDCLQAAAKLGWVDGIMMSYNFQTMNTDRMKAAVDACAKAGIGLTAMKTQGMRSFGNMPRPKIPFEKMSKEERDAFLAKMREQAQNAPPDEQELKITERFRNKGFSMEQAKVKLVWENPHIATICSAMYNMAVLKQNVEAATGKVQLTQKDKELLASYAACTSHMYCPQCTRNCQVDSEKDLPIGDVMRSLMYANSYGDRDLGKTTFQSLPAEIREAIPGWDYTAAELRCPNNLPIGRLMREAAVELS